MSAVTKREKEPRQQITFYLLKSIAEAVDAEIQGKQSRNEFLNEAIAGYLKERKRQALIKKLRTMPRVKPKFPFASEMVLRMIRDGREEEYQELYAMAESGKVDEAVQRLEEYYNNA